MDIRPGLDKDTEVCGFTREAEGKPERLEDMGGPGTVGPCGWLSPAGVSADGGPVRVAPRRVAVVPGEGTPAARRERLVALGRQEV